MAIFFKKFKMAVSRGPKNRHPQNATFESTVIFYAFGRVKSLPLSTPKPRIFPRKLTRKVHVKLRGILKIYRTATPRKGL